MNFSKKLNSVRKNKKITAQQMADMLDMQIRSYRKYESGDAHPSLANLIKIADYLGCSVDYLLDRTDNPEVNR